MLQKLCKLILSRFDIRLKNWKRLETFSRELRFEAVIRDRDRDSRFRDRDSKLEIVIRDLGTEIRGPDSLKI